MTLAEHDGLSEGDDPSAHLAVFDAAASRARVFCGTLLPLLEPLARARPDLAGGLMRAKGVVQLEAKDTDAAARLRIGDARVIIEQGRGDADVSCVFSDAGAMNAFFAGKTVLPRVTPAWGLARARLLFEAVRLLANLRVLEPPTARARAAMKPVERVLRVRLVLELLTRAVAQLADERWEPATRLLSRGGERLYTWTVRGDETLSVYLAQRRAPPGPARLEAGRGSFEPAGQRPFVSFEFADVDAAFDLLVARDDLRAGIAARRLVARGSPETAIALLIVLQRADALLAQGLP